MALNWPDMSKFPPGLVSELISIRLETSLLLLYLAVSCIDSEVGMNPWK